MSATAAPNQRASRAVPVPPPARPATPCKSAAAAAEELSASIGEISRQVGQAARVSQSAVDETRQTDAIVRALAEGAGRIGQVVDLISNIAGQTNLLALNATIEARACRRCRPRLRRGRLRSQSPGHQNRRSHGRYRPADPPDPGIHRTGGASHPFHYRNQRAGEHDRHLHRRRRGRTGRRHSGNRPQTFSKPPAPRKSSAPTSTASARRQTIPAVHRNRFSPRPAASRSRRVSFLPK